MASIKTAAKAAAVALAALVIPMVAAPSVASAVRGEETNFTIFLFMGEVTTTHAGNHVVRADVAFRHGASVGSSVAFCCQAHGDLSWTINLEQTSGAVSGTWAIGGNPVDVEWTGTLRGRVTAAGGEGIVRAESNTGARFTGRWSYEGQVALPAPPGLTGVSLEITGAVME